MFTDFYPFLLFLVAIYSIALAWAAWRRSDQGSMQLFALLMLCIATWCFGQGMELASTGYAAKSLWYRFQFLGIAPLPVFWLIFALDFTERLKQFKRWQLAALWLVPLTTILLVLTNQWHGLVWSSAIPTSFLPGSELAYTRGPWFWLSAVYAYVLILVGMFLLVSAAFRVPGLHRAQSITLAAGAVAPLAASLMYLGGITISDLTPVAFSITGLILGWNILCFQFMDLDPLARAQLVDDLSDGVLVLDSQDRIVVLNRSARAIFGLEPRQHIVGVGFRVMAAPWADLLDQSGEGRLQGKVSLPGSEEAGRQYEVTVSHIRGRRLGPTGRLFVIRDVTPRSATERELLESEARFRMLLETAPDTIFLTNTQGNITQANRRASELFGYLPGELSGRPVRILIPDYPAALHEVPQAGILSQKTAPSAKNHEVTGRHRDGHEIALSLSYSPLITTDGVLYINIAHDITLLRKTEERLRLQGAALNAAANGIVVSDPDGVILWVNPAFSEITGYLAHEVIGKSTRILRSGVHGQDFYHQMWETIKSGEIWRGEITNRRKDGSMYLEDQTISPVFGARGEIINFIAIKQDVTEQKRVEVEIRQRARELAIINEIGQAAASDLDLATLITLAGDKIQEKFKAWMIYIALLNPETNLMEFPYCVVEGEPWPDPQPIARGEGLTSIVLEKGMPLLIDENYVETADRLGAIADTTPTNIRPKTWIGVPIVSGERVIGVLSVQDSTREHAYSTDDLNLFTTIAANLGVAIENAQLFQAEQERRAVAETLQEVSAAITASLKREEVLGVILEQLRRVVAYDSASIMQWDEKRNLHIVAHAGFADPALFDFDPTPEDAPSLWKAVDTRTSVLIADTSLERSWKHNRSVGCWIGIPMLNKGEVMGVLNIDSKTPRFYTERHIRIASIFADQAAIAIENARLYGKAQLEISHRKQAEESLRESNRSMLQKFREIEELQEQLKDEALRDPVTGLHNRRFLNESLPHEIARAQRENIQVGVIMMDLDHFKKINDAYGHVNGDRALVALGELLGAQTRSSDIACRYGGEEFCLIMPGASLKGVAERAEELRARFEKIEIQVDNGSFHVTISLGAAIYPMHGDTSEELISRADQALYQAKQAGRNCVVISS